MAKTAISVTLEKDNLLWLRGRVKAAGGRSVSEALDQLIADARAGGQRQLDAGRSVLGTIDIDATDPLLLGADALVRAQFETSTRRLLLAGEDVSAYGVDRPKLRKGTRRRG